MQEYLDNPVEENDKNDSIKHDSVDIKISIKEETKFDFGMGSDTVKKNEISNKVSRVDDV